MQIQYIIILATRNMWRQKFRSGMTVLGIAVAILSFGMLRTVVDSWYAGAELGSASRLITRNATSLALPLPLSYAERIRRVEGVESVTWANWFGGVYIDEKNFFPQFAVDADSYFRVYDEFVVEPSQLSDFKLDRRGVIVGEKTARKFNWKVGDQIPLRGTLYPGNWSFVIRGIYTGKDDKVDTSQMIMHWTYVNETIKSVLPNLAVRVGVYVVNLSEGVPTAQASELIDSGFRNSVSETRTETQKAFQLGFIAMVDTILVAIQTVAYVVILIIMAVMANTMAMAARERTREYSTLRSLGFSAGFINALIFGESMALSLLGGVIGIALSFPAASGFFSLTRDLFLVFEITQTTLVLQLLACVVIGFFAAIAPMLNSRRIRIVDGLRAVT